MFNWFLNFCLLIISVSTFWYAYSSLNEIIQILFVYLSGLIFGIFIMNIKLIVKNSKINLYKRELEKEAISSDENSAKVKVLEQKIVVLEKALERALDNNK